VTAPPTAAIEVRRLTYADLPQVVAIERRAFTTPWSLAMFVLELSKPSGVCLAAEVDRELAGYLVCSRYDLAWHIMNVSVDPDRRRRGIATAMMNALFERVGDADPLARLLGALARSAIAVLSEPPRERLQICRAPSCGMFFLGARRWCCAACGNRARAARHYRRTRA
jgi:GNAT superfamily N-acetyltransferase